MPATPDTLRDWLDLIRTDARSPKVAAVLERYGTSIDKASWTHGSGKLALHAAGLYLILWKPGSGRSAPVEVVGIDFSFSGMRGGKNYSGPVPFGIAKGDSIDQLRGKLAPLPVEVWHHGRIASAYDETQRYGAILDSRGTVTRFMVMAQFEMRRVPPSSSLISIDTHEISK